MCSGIPVWKIYINESEKSLLVDLKAEVLAYQEMASCEVMITLVIHVGRAWEYIVVTPLPARLNFRRSVYLNLGTRF